MRIGILTYHFSDNYGALLQAYALRKWFLDRGADASFINYHPRYVEEGGEFGKFWHLTSWRKNATIAYMRLSHYHRILFGSRRQRASFDGFRKLHLGISGERIEHLDEVEHVAQEFDLLVCGSDQIWNPSVQRGLDPIYFLDFKAGKEARKISYAPSFGRGEIEVEYTTRDSELTNTISIIFTLRS